MRYEIPRDLSGAELAKLLRVLGYEPTRQTGRHLRLTTQQRGEHHVTIPNHSPLKLGTIAGILGDVARHFATTREELLKQLLRE